MPRTFSDQWYRISGLRLALRPGLSVRLHHYRGEPWYVLRDRAHNGFFRANPATYRFLNRLDVASTLDEIWRTAVNEAPQETPGQEEVFELVAALYKANLVHVEGGVDEARIVERFEAKQRKPFAARLSELLFMRIPLCDPDPWLTRRQGFIDRLISWPVALLALALVAWAGIELALAGPRAWTQAQDILQFDNLLLLYAATLVSHLLHEFGHASACKRFGGEVRQLGMMLLMFTPLPYVDLSASWSMRNRWQRVLVGGAGMVVDLVVGAVATLVWAWSPPGVVNELAFNLMFTTVIYTVVFNINPLMRFDGYYMLADWLEIPNLHQQAQQQFQRWWRVHVLRSPGPEGSPMSDRRRHGLVAFFLVSNAYRLMVMGGIVLFVADQYLGVGLLVAAALLVTNFLMPLQRLLRPLSQPLFRFQHQRLLRWAGGALVLLLAALLLVPVPDSRVLDGVVEASHNSRIHTDSGGIVQRVAATPGQWVEVGTLLVELSNPELESELLAVQAQRRQAEAQEARALSEGGVDLDPVRERLRTLDGLRRELMRQRDALLVKAPHAGIWVAPETAHRSGSWVARGAELGTVVDEREHVFKGVLRQEAALALTALEPGTARVRIEGERARLRDVTRLTLLPHSQSTLPSAALTPLAGGTVPVLRSDNNMTHAAESFFLLRAELAPEAPAADGSGAALRHGRSSWIRIELPASPLAAQGWTWLRQYVQRRYAV
jgi:putative peptide zinc metalloprotease protein